MRRALRISWLCAAVACGSNGPPIEHRAVTGDLAIVGATVVPMDRPGTLAGHTILVRGDRIVAVARAAAIDTRAATILDGKGKWVVPGLADMHVHTWGEDALGLYVLNGVTTVRDLFGSPQQLRWRDAIARGELAGPTLIAAGPIIDGDPPTWPGSAVITTADAARAEVAAQQAAGYDWLKVYGGLSLEAYTAVVDEAKRRGMPIAGHVPKAVGLAATIASGQRSIEHLDGYVPFVGDPPGPMIEPTVAAGVWNCPTLVVTDRFGALDDPAQLAGTRGLEHVPAMMRAAWDPKQDFRLKRFTPEMFASVRAKNQLRRQLVIDLHRAEAHLVLGTDTGNPYVVPGFAVVDELALLVTAGLTPWEALRTATAAAAELQGTPAGFGVIAAGARADLLVVDRDPLADVHHLADPAIVVVRGKPQDRAALLAAVAKPAKPADPLASFAALPPEGTVIATARYEIELFGQVIGAERVVLSAVRDQALVIRGQSVIAAPQETRLEYRSTRDELDLTTAAIDPPRVVVSRRGKVVVAAHDPAPPVELAAAADAVIAPQAMAEFFWYAAALAELPVGASRTLTAVEVMTDGRLALHPGSFTFTREADADQRRSYALTGTHGTLDVTGRMTVDPDGAPHEVTVTVKFGTFVTRRTE